MAVRQVHQAKEDVTSRSWGQNKKLLQLSGLASVNGSNGALGDVSPHAFTKTAGEEGGSGVTAGRLELHTSKLRSRREVCWPREAAKGFCSASVVVCQ